LLSAREVLNAHDGDHSDGGNLVLRVRGDSTSWVFRFTSPAGRRREMGIGPAHRGNVQQAGATLGSARDAAHRAREILRAGVDPIDARDNQRVAERQADAARRAGREREHWTLARSARDYHERVIEPTKTPRHAAQWIASLENHVFASVWTKPIGTITPPELLSALLAVRPHERARRHSGNTVPETLRRIRQRLDTIFEDAVFHGRCAANPAAAIKRKMREARPQVKAGRFAALPYREAPGLMQRLRNAPGTAARCLELALMTAARTNEVLGAVWSEFDLDAGVWVVPAPRMKAKEEHVVFLPPRAIQVLKTQKALDLNASIVFPSPMDPTRALSNMAMLEVLGRLGMRTRTTVHGLCRSTFSTWANETGAARSDVVEACLAHREQDRVRAAYNRATFDADRRALLIAWADYLGEPAAEVLLLRAA